MLLCASAYQFSVTRSPHFTVLSCPFHPFLLKVRREAWPVSKKSTEKKVTDDPRYHNTWRLLKKYRDVVWSMEVSVQQLRNKFEIEYGVSIEDFLDSIYLAGANLSGTDLEHHAQCIERSHKMLKLVENAVELLHTRHKNGEEFYWLLYYTYLSPQKLKNLDEVIDQLRPHIRDISVRTYYRKRNLAVEALSSVLWGYTSQDTLKILDEFLPEDSAGK